MYPVAFKSFLCQKYIPGAAWRMFVFDGDISFYGPVFFWDTLAFELTMLELG